MLEVESNRQVGQILNVNEGNIEQYSPLNINIKNTGNSTVININNMSFIAQNHWFWEQFSDNWEPQTINFFQSNLKKGTDYLDIGAWVGPTAFIATALGARKIKIIEPNPVNFFHLLAAQINNNLLDKWFLVNACVSNTVGSAIIGPIEGIKRSSSATNIRDQGQAGATIISMRLKDFILDNDYFSLIKIDIEGAEALIVEDLNILSNVDTAIWLSIHPPFIKDNEDFLRKLLAHSNNFYFVDENNLIIPNDVLSMRVLTKEEKPLWGTKWGNFFEIGLLPKVFFEQNGRRKN